MSKKLIQGVNDLKTTDPELIAEWDFEKNSELGVYPDQITRGCGKKVWWKCQQGHSWETQVYNRTSHHQKCAICSNHRVVQGLNDLATVHPELIAEWDYEKNNSLGILPNTVYTGSGKKVWWKCQQGHSWKSAVVDRVKAKGCPYCRDKKGKLRFFQWE